ncbi:MAG: tetratricopeptide repeat protein [Myxococcales bacterium]|nr:MAG: tetratricopeptide repeat protein [Myxococcales bacterium]
MTRSWLAKSIIFWMFFSLLSDQSFAQPTQGTDAEEQTATDGAEGAGAKDTANAESENDSGKEPAASTPTEDAGDIPDFLRTDSEAPSFLKIQDVRIKDERPEPTAAQVKALLEMEAEVERFSKTGTGYQQSVGEVLRRDYLRQRRDRDEAYAHRIKEEELREDKARDNAIVLFEKFIAKFPNDSRYTADAMFRLGELYYERSAIRFQAALDAATEEREKRLAENQPTDDILDPEKDFTDTIRLYQKLIQRFPEYKRIAGVYYLVGYCLNEEGKVDEARLAWLSLVCHNHYDYHRDLPVPDLSVDDTKKTEEEKHPALALDEPDPLATVFEDPYGSCVPVVEESEFYTETWLRIGEYHFDYDYKEHALSRAISAYRKILAFPQDRVYNLALYKLAWSYYRASRYPESIRHFAMLVQWSDDEKKRTGRAGTELRSEAIQYLGIAFAYDDWNENQIPDPSEGQSTGLQRIQDPSLLPQDREWTPEVYFQLGFVYFDEAKYPQAIEAWQIALERFPNHHRAPEIQNQISLAYSQHNEMGKALDAKAVIGEKYQEGSDWWNANMEYPREQRLAEELAQDALIGAAVQHHQQAQSLRRRCVQDRMPELCREAQLEYSNAASAYKLYIEKNPNSPQAYELQYNLAEALYWSEQYEEAAVAYAAVRDSNLDDKHLSESARRVVESFKRIADLQQEDGALKFGARLLHRKVCLLW